MVDRTSMSSGSGDVTLGVSEQVRLLEGILKKLLNKDAMPAPQQCEKSAVKLHLENLRHYFKASGMTDNESKIITLFNTLSDEMRFELCGQLQFKDHENDYEWIERKLMDLFHPKESELTPLVKLFACKQKPEQHIREFLSEIRIEGYKLLRSMDSNEREKHLIDAFIKGLRNEELKSAISRMDVRTLDDAYNLVKKEKSPVDACCVRKVEDDNQQTNSIEKLQNQMAMIQKQLGYIVTILQNSKPSYAEALRKNIDSGKKDFTKDQKYTQLNPQRQREYQRQEIICWTCGKEGHIGRFCERNKCTSCGMYGHIAANCRRNRRSPKRFRQINVHNDSWDSYDMPDDLSEVSIQTESDTCHQEQDVTAEVHAMTIHHDNLQRKKEKKLELKNSKRNQTKVKQYPEEVNDIYEYVQGRRSWKNIRFSKPDTLITKFNPEKAKNKPIINGKCEGRQAKLFLDTGAEINLIDKDFAQKIGVQSRQIAQEGKYIKCANNTRMNTSGWVKLKIKAGNEEKFCKFWIVEKLFPRIIMGIRAMKDMAIAVDPARNCVWVKDLKVPLLSKVYTQSINGSEN